ncbi:MULTISPECIES: anti-phage-associated helicase HerA [Proteus]|uniref:anti-phage-associated helicase HerA n=1 Tax=Proteus TaxID=583 RepID=UPI00132FB7C3|nr:MULTISPECIES: anti-phage-associated helicase HerA [Proteus]MBI6406925.1 ATP-binding protein [Proteus sp. PR00208]MDM3562673.1 ATP-binding protein [Proteus vulgaris]QJW50463.1 ATP-binding protein [Proteus terrae subsp. cibarius]
MTENLNAEVISVYPDKVKVSIDDLESFRLAEEHLKVGSYLRIADSDDVVLIAVIDSFSIEVKENGNRKYIIESSPLGVIKDHIFYRGGDSIAIPPKKVEPAKISEIESIYKHGLKNKEAFTFSRLSHNGGVSVPVDGDKFFNKHIGIVGSTGSGKSHTVATILQKAISEKSTTYSGMNNSHIIIFDIHGEYSSAFPLAHKLNVDDIVLPYWLLNSEELEELFLDTGDNNNYNQSSVLRNVITQNKKKHNPNVNKVFYDSPLKFDIEEVLNCLINLKNETVNSKAVDRYMIADEEGDSLDSTTTEISGLYLSYEDKLSKYFEKTYSFRHCKNSHVTKGIYADGTLDKFVSRFISKYKQDRLKFLFSKELKDISFEDTIKQFIGYKEKKESNVTIIDLSGIPFEVLSITVSLISRILFDFGYYHKKSINNENNKKHDIPILLVLEEAHKYVPKSELARFKASKNSIERIAKEGRKYGVTLLLASQRPSEISETIFSQCSNFIAMRLTNPDDQNYIRRILPDTFGNLTSNLSSLQTGEALLMGDATILPSLVKIDITSQPPSSSDIPYLKIWKNKWELLDFKTLMENWRS